MTGAAIRTEALTKRYGARRGIEDVTLEVRRGEVFGFLGPNGSGKTTTIRTLLDILRPTSGRAEVLGLDARQASAEIHRRVGYLPGELGLAEKIAVGQQLAFLASLRGGVDPAAIEDLAARFDLDLTRQVRALSRGNKQKVGLVQAFMHDPELLILDEPTGGLDPLMQRAFNDLVRERRARGRTVFLSSHILGEVEALCDRVAIIRAGRIVAIEPVAAIKARAVREVRARFSAPPRASLLDGVANVLDARIEGDALRCRVRGDAGDLVRALATPDLVDVAVQEPALEDVFLGYYDEGRHAGGEAT